MSTRDQEEAASSIHGDQGAKSTAADFREWIGQEVRDQAGEK